MKKIMLKVLLKTTRTTTKATELLEEAHAGAVWVIYAWWWW